MSNREYAIDLIAELTDEQVDNLVRFIAGFSKVRVSAEKVDREESRRQSFERLNRMIRSVPIEDEKELLRKYREEKYGV